MTHGHRQSKSEGNSGSSGKVVIKYSEDLIMAVKYLIKKGFNSREIADRLGISPYTVRNIKRILRERGLLKTEEPKKAKTTVENKSKKPESIIEKILSSKKQPKATVKDKSKKSEDIIKEILGSTKKPPLKGSKEAFKG